MSQTSEMPYLSELHVRYTSWLKDLEFYRDEVKTFNTRLEEIVVRNTKIEITSQVEQFQNRFIRQNEVIDILHHDIAKDHKRLVYNAKSNNVATDRRRVEDNLELTQRMSTFVKLFEELKKDFAEFLTKTY